jgi:ABC-type transport system involved in multi-copper enzyme maturation permease subunit
MPVQTLTIAKNTFIESIRQPIFFVLVMLCGILQFFTTWGTGFAMGYTESGEVSGDDKLQFDVGLSTVLVCGMLLAALTATAVISREIENKTVLTVVSKPIGRPTLILGKYLGVAASLLIAIVPMVMFLLMGIRHGVMSTAADDPDQPVLLFSFLAIGIAVGVAVWCNFFYGWYFSQTCILILAPGMFIAYVVVLCISKKWHWQFIGVDMKPQIYFACIGMSMAILVLAAIATAVSTRLGQVMTTAVCVGIFLFGLLSNYLIGRHVFTNRIAAMIQNVGSESIKPGWDEPGSTYHIKIQSVFKIPVHVGDAFYYSSSPSGVPMEVPDYPAFTGDVDKADEAYGPNTPAALVITQVDSQNLTVKRVGSGPFQAERPPAPNDYVFIAPTKVSIPALVVWGIVPNLHYFWLVDAVSQNQLIPFTHLFLILFYSLAQIGVFLSLGVILFQRRDVG